MCVRQSEHSRSALSVPGALRPAVACRSTRAPAATNRSLARLRLRLRLRSPYPVGADPASGDQLQPPAVRPTRSLSFATSGRRRAPCAPSRLIAQPAPMGVAGPARSLPTLTATSDVVRGSSTIDTAWTPDLCDSGLLLFPHVERIVRRPVLPVMRLVHAVHTGCAVNFTPKARATFMTVSKRGFAPGASAL